MSRTLRASGHFRALKRLRLLPAVVTVGGVSLLAVLAATSAAGGSTDLVSAAVRTAQGAPAAGVQVHVFSDSDTSLAEVGAATTDAGGAWSLSVTPTPELAALAGANGGYLNFLAIASDGSTAHGLSHFTRLLTSGRWIDTSGDARGTPTIRLERPVPGGDTAVQAAACITLFPSVMVVATAEKLSDIGELHVARDTTGTYDYGESADSSFDVGANIAGNGWALNGTHHVGNSGSAAISWTRAQDFGHRLQSLFQIVKRRIAYRGYPPFSGCPPDYDAYPSRWDGGALVGLDNSSYDYNCLNSPYSAAYAAGTTFDRTSSRAHHFGAAVNLFGLISVGVDSGYSRNVGAHWRFGTAQPTHVLCGNDDYPVRARRIFAGSHR